MTIKEFTGMQSEFAPKRVEFTVEGVPLTIHNFDLFAGKPSPRGVCGLTVSSRS